MNAEPKECLKCGYIGPRLYSYSTSKLHTNIVLRFFALTLMVIPGIRTLLFHELDGTPCCPKCSSRDCFAYWRGPVEPANLELWRQKQEVEDSCSKQLSRELAAMAFVWLLLAAILVAAYVWNA